MNESPNYIVVCHDDGSTTFAPRECVLCVTEWLDEDCSVENTMMNCRIMLKNNQGYVVGKYNRKTFSPVDLFNKPDTSEVMK